MGPGRGEHVPAPVLVPASQGPAAGLLPDEHLRRRRPRIEKDFPQIERTAYLQDNGPVFLKDGQAYSTKNWMFTNADFLKVVNLPLIAGTDASGAADRGR